MTEKSQKSCDPEFRPQALNLMLRRTVSEAWGTSCPRPSSSKMERCPSPPEAEATGVSDRCCA